MNDTVEFQINLFRALLVFAFVTGSINHVFPFFLSFLLWLTDCFRCWINRARLWLITKGVDEKFKSIINYIMRYRLFLTTKFQHLIL